MHRLRAVEQQGERATEARVLDVGVGQLPEAATAAVAGALAAGRGDEVVVIGIARIPGTVLDAIEAQPLGGRLCVLVCAGLVPIDVGQLERHRRSLVVRGPEAGVVHRIHGGRVAIVERDDVLPAVLQAGTGGRPARRDLAPDVRVQLARSVVLVAHDQRRVTGVVRSQRVLPREQSETRQLPRVAIGIHGEGAAFVAVLLVGEVELAQIALARPPVEQLVGLGEAARAEAVELVGVGGERLAVRPRAAPGAVSSYEFDR